MRRIFSCLLLGAFCCTLAAGCDEPTPPLQKDSSSNPVDAAKKTGGEPFKMKPID